MSASVGVDVGGSTLRAARVAADGTVEASAKRSVREPTPEEALEQVGVLLDEIKAPEGPVGFGLAAQLWLEEGRVAVAPSLGWRDVPFRQLAEERLGRTVRLVNDLNAITVGEARCGAGRGSEDVMCVFVGTGVGMGAVCQGRIIEGADGLATELGHTKVGPPDGGLPCGCGERGCLEAYCSGKYLPNRVAALAARGTPSGLLDEVSGDLHLLTAERIERAAVANDRVAVELWNDVADRLGRAVANAVTLFNPRVLVLGGGVLESAPTLRSLTVGRIGDYGARSHAEKLEIRDSSLGDEAGMIGAALLASGS